MKRYSVPAYIEDTSKGAFVSIESASDNLLRIRIAELRAQAAAATREADQLQAFLQDRPMLRPA